MESLEFWEQLVATVIGTFAGFIFSIFLYYLTERLKSKQVTRELSNNIQREITYNIQYVSHFKVEMDRMLRLIAAGEKQVYITFKLGKLQRLFVFEAFQKGLLYKYLTPDEVSDLDAMLNYFTVYRDQYLTTLLTSYASGQVAGPDALRTFEWDREQLEIYHKLMLSLKDKLKNLK